MGVWIFIVVKQMFCILPNYVCNMTVSMEGKEKLGKKCTELQMILLYWHAQFLEFPKLKINDVLTFECRAALKYIVIARHLNYNSDYNYEMRHVKKTEKSRGHLSPPHACFK